MKYLLLIYNNEQSWNAITEGERQQIYGSISVREELLSSGQFVTGSQLQPISTATTVRVRDGKELVTDGPFAETRMNNSAVIFSLKRRTSTKRPASPRASRPRKWERSKCDHSSRPLLHRHKLSRGSSRINADRSAFICEDPRLKFILACMSQARETLEHVFREEYGRIIATLIRISGSFDLAEEALQEAFTSAASKWEVEGTQTTPARG